MQLTRGMPGKLGHHCRTKCALSGHHGGNGKGFGFKVGLGGGGAGSGVRSAVEVVEVPALLLSREEGGVSA